MNNMYSNEIRVEKKWEAIPTGGIANTGDLGNSELRVDTIKKGFWVDSPTCRPGAVVEDLSRTHALAQRAAARR
jgi:hypothetical protein